MRRLRVRKAARAEIAAAFDWYLLRSPTAAQQFLNAVDDAMALIEEAPEGHPIICGHLRRVLLRRFPYAALPLGKRAAAELVLAEALLAAGDHAGTVTAAERAYRSGLEAGDRALAADAQLAMGSAQVRAGNAVGAGVTRLVRQFKERRAELDPP